MLDGQEGIGVELPAEVLDGFANRSGMRRQVEEAEVNEGGIEAGMSIARRTSCRSPYCRRGALGGASGVRSATRRPFRREQQIACG